MNQMTPQDGHTRNKNKDLRFGAESRKELLKGIDIIANAVKATLGPRGRNVVIEQTRTVGLMQTLVGRMPRITKDGVSVAREINVEDRFQNLGVQIIKEVATRQNEQAGDGTTTATVLAQSIAHEAMSCVDAGSNPVTLKREIDDAVKEAIDFITLQAKDVRDSESLKSIATISANGDKEVGDIVSKAVEEVGPDGIITVEAAPLTKMTLDIVEGMEFPAGFATPHFITDTEKGIVDYKDCWALFYNGKINDIKELVGILEKAHQAEKSLVIVCHEMADDVMATLVFNKMKNGFKVVVLKLPEYLPMRSEFMEDLAIITGGTVVSVDSGMTLTQVKEEHFGKCSRVRINAELSEFIDGSANQESLDARVSGVRTKLESTPKEDRSYDLLKSRLAKLTGGIAIIRVGGSSEIDINERKDRIEDAINATKAAVEEGIVPGGGTMLLRASSHLFINTGLSSQGRDIIIKALQSPFYTILENAGIEGEEAKHIMLNVLKTKTEGFDVDKNIFCDLIKKGIIDPAKVVKNALKDAAGVVGLLITTEVAIVNKEGAE